MERYNKYIVVKNEDIERYLSDEQQIRLSALLTRVRTGRLNDGKQDQKYVCVAADWPMYETVWGMIEAYVDGKPDELTRLQSENAALEADAERYRWIRNRVYQGISPLKQCLWCIRGLLARDNESFDEAIDAAMRGN